MGKRIWEGKTGDVNEDTSLKRDVPPCVGLVPPSSVNHQQTSTGRVGEDPGTAEAAVPVIACDRDGGAPDPRFRPLSRLLKPVDVVVGEEQCLLNGNAFRISETARQINQESAFTLWAQVLSS